MPVTDAMIQDWADEAEAGDGVEKLRKRGRSTVGEGDGMEPDAAQDDRSLHELALELVGSFSRVQEVIDMLARRYFEARTPGLAEFVNEHAFKRISDKERRKVFQLLAQDLGVAVPIEQLGHVFGRVKNLRDDLSHSSKVVEQENDTLTAVRSFVVNTDGSQESRDVARTELTLRLKECDWLQQWVTYVLAESDLSKHLYLNGHEVRVVRPTDDPAAWEGELFVSLGPSEKAPPV